MFIVLAALLAAVLLGAAIVSPRIVERLEARRARRELEHAARLAMVSEYGYRGEALERMGLDPERYTLLADRLSRTASP